MVWNVDERIPKDLFFKLIIEKANIFKDHFKNSINQLIIVDNIGPTMAVFKFYDLKEEDSLKLHMTLQFRWHWGANTSIVGAIKLFVATILYSMWKSQFLQK